MILTRDQKNIAYHAICDRRDKAKDDLLYYTALLNSAKELNIDVEKYTTLVNTAKTIYNDCLDLIRALMEE
jgi:hypothetical protein